MTKPSDVAQLRSIHRQLRFATFRVVVALMLREISATHGRRVGGYLWTVLEPVAGVGLLAWLFSSIGFRQPALGTNFALFYATGLLPFYLFNAISGQLTGALSASKALLNYPRVTIMDVIFAKLALHLITQLVVIFVLLVGITVFADTGSHFLGGRVVLGFAMAAALGAGIGTMNCYLSRQFPIYPAVFRLATRPLMLVSGVMFLIESLPPEWRKWFLWNPLVHPIAEVRSGFYHGYDPYYISPSWVFGVAMLTGTFGLLFLWRYYREVLHE